MKQIITPIIYFIIAAILLYLIFKYADDIPSFWLAIIMVFLFTGTIIIFMINPSFLFEQNKKKSEDRFIKAVDQMIVSQSFNLDDISLLAENYQLEHMEVEKILLNSFSTKIELEGVSTQTNALSQTIRKLKDAEPFINLPETIRIYLLQLDADTTQANRENIKMLANSISEFIIKAAQQNKTERIKATVSLILGLLGLILTVYFSVKPN